MAKRWVIGDVHGCSQTLRTLVQDKIRLSQEDHLYFVGDYIDRGPDSKGVIEYVMELRMFYSNVKALKGNHEEMMLNAFKDRSQVQAWFYNGGMSTLNSFRVKEVKQVPGHFLEFIDSLDYFISLDDFVIVHAGLNFEIDDPFEDKEAMLWIRNQEVLPEKVGNRKIVHGHTPIALDEIKESLQNDTDSIDLDNGCVYYGVEGLGSLVALELNSMHLEVQKNIDI